MAITGSILMFFSIYFLFTGISKNNDLIFTAASKIVEISENKKLSQEAKENKTDIETKKIEIAGSDNRSLPFFSAIVAAMGLTLFFFGFYNWIVRIYPDEESLRKEQLRGLIIQNNKSKNSNFRRNN